MSNYFNTNTGIISEGENHFNDNQTQKTKIYFQ